MVEVEVQAKEGVPRSEADFLSSASPEILLGQTVNIEDLEQLMASKAKEVVIQGELDRKGNREAWIGMGLVFCLIGDVITGGVSVLLTTWTW